jgi:hypothetical protein
MFKFAAAQSDNPGLQGTVRSQNGKGTDAVDHRHSSIVGLPAIYVATGITGAAVPR